ncbi:MarR family transcriptional regulator [Mycolicibacterium vinylchloridicum]|uniref:MarR family transcriptional regulator n=1 Tax=Mycolicibacterium vinylchloridicum TaxID=2736928 RepID=UPI0015CBB7BE|nr:MarR family transcriptional regulator [Mycolicibacterium vinylchloridicum]
MDRQRLHLLGKQLISLSRQADLQPQDARSSAAEQLVLGDVALYPHSTIREIVERTGFTQGYVSKCVAELGKNGLVATVTDAADRRRTLVTPTPRLLRAIARRTMPFEELIQHAIPTGEDPKRVIALLDQLAEILLR